MRTEVQSGFRNEVTEDGQSYAQADLNAQQEMALWALVMAVAAVATFFVSLYVAILVKKTLKATAEAADHAKTMADEAQKATTAALRAADASEKSIVEQREISRAQSMAYLVASGFRCRINRDGKVAIRFNLVNAGQSPARKVQTVLHCTVWQSETVEGPAQIQEKIARNELPKALNEIALQPSMDFHDVMASGASRDLEQSSFSNLDEAAIERLANNPSTIAITLRTDYFDVFDRPQSEIAQYWIITGKNDKGDFLRSFAPMMRVPTTVIQPDGSEIAALKS